MKEKSFNFENLKKNAMNKWMKMWHWLRERDAEAEGDGLGLGSEVNGHKSHPNDARRVHGEADEFRLIEVLRKITRLSEWNYILQQLQAHNGKLNQ